MVAPLGVADRDLDVLRTDPEDEIGLVAEVLARPRRDRVLETAVEGSRRIGRGYVAARD